MMKRRKKNIVHSSEFFSNSLNISYSPVKKRSKLKMVSAFMGLSLLLSVILTVPPVVAFSSVVPLAEPFVAEWKNLPSELGDVEIGEKNVFYDVNGNVFAEVWTENRVPLSSLEDVGQTAIDALIATEDKTFYEHQGYDPKGMVRSLVSGSGGGSGITQQLVKNLQFYDLTHRDSQNKAVERTLERKLRELKLAIEYEKNHSKDEILLSYFNTVAFGDPNTYSIQSASQSFFGKNSKDLSLAEASALVGSVQNPSVFNLREQSDTPQWKNRQYDVLTRMVAENKITEEQKDSAYSETLNILPKTYSGNCASSSNPFYCEYVLDFLRSSPKLAETQEERDSLLARGGLHVKTHYDPTVSAVLNDQLMSDYGKENRVAVPSAIVKRGGAVSAIGVNREYGEGAGQTTLNLPLNPAGSGSTFKMFTLATALVNGFSEKDLAFSSRCPLYDPDYDTPPGGFRNATSCAYQGGFMDYQKATKVSSNTWFVELEIKVGVESVKDFARSVGLSAPESITHRSLSYTLGATEDSPVSLASAFSTFSNGGVYCPPTPIASYSYADGSTLPVPDTYDPSVDSCRRVMSPHDASVVLKAMRTVVDGNVFAVPGVQTVAKTGTNQLFNSTWAHISGEYTAYYNMYDPDQLTNEIDYVNARGDVYRWWDHAVALTGRDVFSRLSSTHNLGSLDFYSQDDSFVEVPVEKRDFITVPSVLGMSPENAVQTLRNYGLNAEVLTELGSTPPGWVKGRVVHQSVEAGTDLARGTKKVVELTVGQ